MEGEGGLAQPHSGHYVPYRASCCCYSHPEQQISMPIRLEGDTFYYIEAVCKEKRGGDYLYVAIQHECDARLPRCAEANEKYLNRLPHNGSAHHMDAKSSLALISGQLYYPCMSCAGKSPSNAVGRSLASQRALAVVNPHAAVYHLFLSLMDCSPDFRHPFHL